MTEPASNQSNGMRPQAAHAGWRRVTGMLCLLAFLTASIGHIAHQIDYGQRHGAQGASMYAVSLGVCPACVALHSSFAETPYHYRQSELSVRLSSAISYQGPPAFGVSLPFFVRPPPAA